MTGGTDHAGPVAGRFVARRPLLLGYVTLAVLAAGLFGWGLHASIAGAVIATGRVEVETREQAVEHFDGGTVGAVLVRDGDRVAAGEALIRLSDFDLHAEAALLEAEATDLAARRNRLAAEFRDADAIVWDAGLVARAQTDPSVAEVLEGQARLFAARRESRAGHRAQLGERIGQTREQIAALQAQGEAVARQREFAARELEAQRTLFERGLAKLPRLMALEREAAQLDGQAGDIAARIAGARGRIAELEIQILQIGTKRVEDAEARAREVQARENQVRERLETVRGKLGRLEIRAPVAGEVYGMTVFAAGEVVHPGEPILKIVPEDAGLLVRARLDPIHIDQVWPGQEAVLRFSAFPARTTPEFTGRVLRVSADAQDDGRTGHSWYEVEVEMGRAILPDASAGGWVEAAWATIEDWLRGGPDGAVPGRGAAPADTPPDTPEHARDLALVPGMPAELHLRTGERSPLSYLAKPLTDYFSRSLREE